jgi:hypothetical protein
VLELSIIFAAITCRGNIMEEEKTQSVAVAADASLGIAVGLDYSASSRTNANAKHETEEEYYADIRQRAADVKTGINIVRHSLIEID